MVASQYHLMIASFQRYTLYQVDYKVRLRVELPG
nr:MAG TPA: hypothetical protein [Caudoviricetes sp.]